MPLLSYIIDSSLYAVGIVWRVIVSYEYKNLQTKPGTAVFQEPLLLQSRSGLS